MDQKNPAYRVTKWLSGLDVHLDSWFDHFVELELPVAIVKKELLNKVTDIHYTRYSVWTIGAQAIGEKEVESNSESMDFEILKVANDFDQILAHLTATKEKGEASYGEG